MKKQLSLLALILFSLGGYAQLKPKLTAEHISIDNNSLEPVDFYKFLPAIPPAHQAFQQIRNYRSFQFAGLPETPEPGLIAYLSEKTGMPYLIEGVLPVSPLRSPDAQVAAYFEKTRSHFNMNSIDEELRLSSHELDEKGIEHFRLNQFWKGIPVYGSEAILHKKQDQFFLFNGRIYPTPKIKNTIPSISAEQGIQIAKSLCMQQHSFTQFNAQEEQMIGGKQIQAELVIYHKNQEAESEKLAWHVTLIPNFTARISYFVDAQNGELLHYRNELCQLVPEFGKAEHNHGYCVNHENPTSNDIFRKEQPIMADGPATAMATDLQGQQRLINTYSAGGVYFMIDASRTMYKPTQSSIPDNPVGTIWTLDAKGTSPENSDFVVYQVASQNNIWSDPKSVSAHYNAAKAYEYFKNTYNRNSINGQGGNIISLINIVESDGSQMDNAFWNGAAMFYGNGKQAFKAPLSKALDITGHEMAHGVIQTTANLEYYGESGALNESFADIFGTMIDRDDWKLGEDVTNATIFKTGAIRDMSNPNNGGKQGDPGWQPANYNERYQGDEDNGGVHINSGIPNKAYQLFADNTAVGKDKAEQVFHRALTKYLVKSSQFVDCRIAVIQSSTDLYGSAVANAAAAAFDAVGIKGNSGTIAQTDIKKNPGNEYVLMTDDKYSALYIFTPAGKEVANPLVSESPISRPSITDDGRAIVFIGKDKTMRSVTIDWATSKVNHQVIQSQPIWRNVAISRDGKRIAALRSDLKNEIYVFSYETQKWSTFKLYNPTTGQNGPTTEDVRYADALEWDFTGEWVIYDALNNIKTFGTSGIEYWDIGFVRVWNNSRNVPGDGFISKLFSGLPDDVSIGFPTFSKNSDYIIAFDYIDDFENKYYMLGNNLETGDLGIIYENIDVSLPSYSSDDKTIVFETENVLGDPVLAFVPLSTDKINSSGNASTYLKNGRWGIWFANGKRVLTDVGENILLSEARLYPNPAKDVVNIQLPYGNYAEVTYNVSDVMGHRMLEGKNELSSGDTMFQILVKDLPPGFYSLQLGAKNEVTAFKFIIE